jgi:hypothetical protein
MNLGANTTTNGYHEPPPANRRVRPNVRPVARPTSRALPALAGSAVCFRFRPKPVFYLSEWRRGGASKPAKNFNRFATNACSVQPTKKNNVRLCGTDPFTEIGMR